MKTYNPVTRIEVTDLQQPIVAIFIITSSTNDLGYRLLYHNDTFYETQVGGSPYGETYFYDPLTTYRVLEKRGYSRLPETNRSIARKITIDTFNFLTQQLSPENLKIYLDGVSTVLNIPQGNNYQRMILDELRKINQGIRYKESLYDPPYIINPGIDLPPRDLRDLSDLNKSDESSSIPSIPRRVIPSIPR